MKAAVKLKIYGIVQGVGFRYCAQRVAKAKNFTGYIKNLTDGTVEVYLEGEEEELKEFMKWCYNGVDKAKVTRIEEDWGKPIGKFSDFVIKS